MVAIAAHQPAALCVLYTNVVGAAWVRKAAVMHLCLPCEKHVSFEFPYVCPEPVLVIT